MNHEQSDAAIVVWLEGYDRDGFALRVELLCHDLDLTPAQVVLAKGWLSSAYRLGAEAEVSEWRPIDTAPKDGTPILAFSPDSDPSVYVIAWVNSGFDGKDYSGWREAGGEGYERYVPTHWMPPPPPQIDRRTE